MTPRVAAPRRRPPEPPVDRAPAPPTTDLQRLAAWLTRQLTDAPGGGVSRQQLRDDAQFLGRETWTLTARARRHQAGNGAGPSRGKRSTAWLGKMLRDLEQDGAILRIEGRDTVTVLDQQALAGWAAWVAGGGTGRRATTR